MHSDLLYFMLIAPIVVFGLAMVARHFAAIHSPESWRRQMVRVRESRRTAMIMALVVPVGYLTAVELMLARFGGSAEIRLLGALPMACVLAGSATAQLTRRPSGDHLHCSKCKYDLDGLERGEPGRSRGMHDARCPECGGQWGWPGGSVRAVKVLSVRWCIITAALLIPMCVCLGSIPIMGIMWWNRALLTLAPTGALVQEVLTSKSFTTDAWAELATRKPTPAQNARIAAQLMRPHAYFSPDELAWLSRALPARILAPELIEPRLTRLFHLTAVYVRNGTGRTVVSTGQIALKLKPNPAEFGPFGGLEISVFMTTHLAGGPATHDTLAIPAAGSSLYRLYTTTPLTPSANAFDDHIRGSMTVVLHVSSSVPPIMDTGGHLALGPGGLNSVTIPLDVAPE